MCLLGYLYWDFNGELWTIPYLDHPVRVYGIIFALGIFLAHYLWKQLAVDFFLFYTPEITMHDIENPIPILDILEKHVTFYDKLSSFCVKAEEQKAFQSWKSKKKYENSLLLPLVKVLNDRTFVMSLSLTKSEEDILTKKHTKWNWDLQGPSLLRCRCDFFFKKGLRCIEQQVAQTLDQLIIYIVVGTVLGARLGHVIFYDLDFYLEHPSLILKTWEGGLASHGGIAGVMIALWVFYKKWKKTHPQFSFCLLLDSLIIPSAFVAFCIRIANFTNQEIIGIPTQVPWAIVFGHPYDGSTIEPRHPAQLYEAGIYIFVFGLMYALWRYGKYKHEGFLTGIFFIAIFIGRFLVEIVKPEQSHFITLPFGIVMGQLLSFPFIFLGIYLAFFRKERKEK